MTRRKSNVVPFERPAAYWVGKARKHDRPSQLPDAARMMRKALEKSGDGNLALELSQIYARMHCCTASERYLMQAAARQGLTGSICFLVGCAALNRGEEDLGERALDLSLRLEPDGLFSERAQEILESYPWKQYPWRPRCARGEALSRRAQWALMAGQPEEAAALAKQAWRKARTPEIAVQLGALLPPGKSAVYLQWAAKRLKNQLRPWLLLALACHRAGQTDKVEGALDRAEALCDTITDSEIYCQTAWEILREDKALAFIDRQIEKMPVSADYMRLRCLTLRRMGEDEKASQALETLLEIDPDDAFALRARFHPEEMDLSPDRFALLYVLGSLIRGVPGRLKRGPLNRALHMMVMALDGDMDTRLVYRLFPPLWYRMTDAERWALDEYREPFYPAALTVGLYLTAGREEKARKMFEAAPEKKRTLRFLNRLLGNDAGKRLCAKGEK